MFTKQKWSETLDYPSKRKHFYLYSRRLSLASAKEMRVVCDDPPLFILLFGTDLQKCQNNSRLQKFFFSCGKKVGKAYSNDSFICFLISSNARFRSLMHSIESCLLPPIKTPRDAVISEQFRIDFSLKYIIPRCLFNSPTFFGFSNLLIWSTYSGSFLIPVLLMIWPRNLLTFILAFILTEREHFQ